MRAVCEVFEPPPMPSGSRQPQLAEEDARQRVVVVLAGVHEHLLVSLAQRPRDGGRLDELWPVAYDGEYPHAAQPSPT
jgi:hypothetical protein